MYVQTTNLTTASTRLLHSWFIILTSMHRSTQAPDPRETCERLNSRGSTKQLTTSCSAEEAHLHGGLSAWFVSLVHTRHDPLSAESLTASPPFDAHPTSSLKEWWVCFLFFSLFSISPSVCSSPALYPWSSSDDIMGFLNGCVEETRVVLLLKTICSRQYHTISRMFHPLHIPESRFARCLCSNP